MTKKLRIQFVLFSTLALIVMQGLIVYFTSHRNYRKLTDNADGIISSIYEVYPKPANVEARYFIVIVTDGQENPEIDLSHTTLVKQKAAAEYAKKVLKKKKDSGFTGIYRYHIYQEEGKSTLIFLSRGGNLEAFKSNTMSTITVSAAGLCVMFLFLLVVSRQVTRPVALSYQKQKEFVTSASHEMKTPLTVIRADTDLFLMENGENEWIQDIREQTDRLTEMTHSLISLARMDEQGAQIRRMEFALSDVAEDAAKSYQALAARDEKEFQITIAPGLSYCGDENLVRQLFTILLDNAFKYSEKNGRIIFSLQKRSRNIVITVTNTSAPVSEKQLSRFFDRFYRSENAAASQKKGYGLGLSIADAIVKKHKGKITADSPESGLIRITAVLR